MSALSRKAAEYIDSAQQIARGEGGRRPEERRHHHRAAFEATLPIAWLGASGEHHEILMLRSRTISAGGICLVARSMMHKGTRGAIRLMLPGRDPALVGIEVTHCRYLGEMQYALGCRFTETPPTLEGLRFVEKNGRLQLGR